VLQLPEVWPRLGQSQTTSPLLLVGGGGGHLHKNCAEQGNASSTPTCCNCHLAEGEKAHPSNYRVAGMLRMKCGRSSSPGEHQKTATGRAFSSNAAAFRGHNDQKIHQETAASAKTSVPEPSKIEQWETCLSVPARIVNREPRNNML
jgi:hypothetical protein